MKKNVLILTNMPTPYRVPLFEKIGSQVDNLVVVYCVEKEKNRKWDVNIQSGKVKYVKLDTKTLSFNDKHIHVSFDVMSLPSTYKDYKYIIGDASYNSYLLALSLKYHGMKYSLWTGWTPANFDKNRLSTYLKKSLIRGALNILSYGTHTTNIIKNFTKKEIINLYNSVDNDFYHKLKLEITKDNSSSRSISKNVVYTGQLIERKNIESLISAVSKISNVNLILVGTGDKSYVDKLKVYADKMSTNTYFMGNKTPKEIYEIYTSCLCLVLPSFDEPWGLVVNEALLFGLPVIVSKQVGCHYDLIKEGYNGFVVDGTESEIKLAIEKILHKNFDKEDIINSVINKSSIKISTEGFMKALFSEDDNE